MKTNTLEQIIEILRKSKHPFLYLYLRKNSFEAPFVGSFECEPLPDGSTLEQKLNAAETWLINFLETSFEGENTFLIEMKMHTRANGNGVIGALSFTYGTAKNQGINGIEQTNNNIYSPASLQALGYIPESEVNYRLLKQELNFKDLLHQKELQDLTKEYKETLESVKDQSSLWTPESIQSLIKEISGIAGVLLNKNKPVEIAGTTPEPEKKQTAKDVIINKSVEKLQNFNLNEIVVINKLIDDFKQTIENNRLKSEQKQTEETKTEQETKNETNE